MSAEMLVTSLKLRFIYRKKRIDAVGEKCVKGNAGNLASTTADKKK